MYYVLKDLNMYWKLIGLQMEVKPGRLGNYEICNEIKDFKVIQPINLFTKDDRFDCRINVKRT
jgi:hypothetical protein